MVLGHSGLQLSDVGRSGVLRFVVLVARTKDLTKVSCPLQGRGAGSHSSEPAQAKEAPFGAQWQHYWVVPTAGAGTSWTCQAGQRTASDPLRPLPLRARSLICHLRAATSHSPMPMLVILNVSYPHVPPIQATTGLEPCVSRQGPLHATGDLLLVGLIESKHDTAPNSLQLH